MGRSRNPVTDGFRGKLGDNLLFRKVNGKSVFGLVPERTQPATPAQLAQRNRFRMASAYAASELSDPANLVRYKEMARRKGMKPRQLAMADYFNSPTVTLIDARAYTGAVGGKITVHAQDELEVVSLSVTILNADGTVAEQGAAVPRTGGMLWDYVATTAKADLAGKIVVAATDRPGNVTTAEQPLGTTASTAL